MSTKLERLKSIKSVIQWHCENNFNEDYYKVVNRIIKKLEANEKFSMDSGKEGGWVAGLLCVVGEDSDLFNPRSFDYDNEYYSKIDVAEACGVSTTTMNSRVKKIREALPKGALFKADIRRFNNVLMDEDFDDEGEELQSSLQELLQEFCDGANYPKENYTNEKYKE